MFVATQYAGFAVGNLGFEQFTFRASATAGSGATITIPSSAKAGDLAILVDRAANDFGGAFPTKIIPSGFTEITGLGRLSATSRPIAVYVSYRILDADDPGTSKTGMNEANEDKIMLVFGGNVSAVAISDVDSQITDSTPSTDTVTASNATSPAIVLGIISTWTIGSTIAYSTASPSFDNSIAFTALRVGYKVYNTSPANHSVGVADEGWGNYVGTCYIQGS